MRRVGWDVGEERLIAALLDEHHRRVEKDVGAIALVGLLLAVELKDGVEVARPGRIGGLPDAASLVNQRFLKTLVDGPQQVVVAEVPFAEDARPVARDQPFFAYIPTPARRRASGARSSGCKRRRAGRGFAR